METVVMDPDFLNTKFNLDESWVRNLEQEFGKDILIEIKESKVVREEAEIPSNCDVKLFNEAKEVVGDLEDIVAYFIKKIEIEDKISFEDTVNKFMIKKFSSPIFLKCENEKIPFIKIHSIQSNVTLTPRVILKEFNFFKNFSKFVLKNISAPDSQEIYFKIET